MQKQLFFKIGSNLNFDRQSKFYFMTMNIVTE